MGEHNWAETETTRRALYTLSKGEQPVGRAEMGQESCQLTELDRALAYSQLSDTCHRSCILPIVGVQRHCARAPRPRARVGGEALDSPDVGGKDEVRSSADEMNRNVRNA